MVYEDTSVGLGIIFFTNYKPLHCEVQYMCMKGPYKLQGPLVHK